MVSSFDVRDCNNRRPARGHTAQALDAHVNPPVQLQGKKPASLNIVGTRVRNQASKTGLYILLASGAAVTLIMTSPSRAQSEDKKPPGTEIMPPLPPAVSITPGEFFVPPGTHTPSNPDTQVCDENDLRTTVQSCQYAVKFWAQELRHLHYLVDSGSVIRDSVKGQAHIRRVEQKLQHDNRVLRFVQLHPSRFSAAPTTLNEHAESDSYVLSPDAETVSKSSNWAGDATRTSWTGSSGYGQVIGMSGTLTVPSATIPTTAGGSGSCDGNGNYYYYSSWWFGIGGTGNFTLFQAGVVARIVCSSGSTQPASPVYEAFEEVYPGDQPQILGTVNAGSVLNITISADIDTETFSPIMKWSMTGSFTSSGSDYADDTENYGPSTGGSVEAISERSFVAGPPSSNKPTYAYPIPFSNSHKLFSDTTYTISFDGGTTTSGNQLNVTYGTPSSCSNGNGGVICMTPFRWSTNANPCDALSGDLAGPEGGGVDYVYEGQAPAASNHYCLTD